ncbi:unnamed protein product [Penicillium bialowiezense]
MATKRSMLVFPATYTNTNHKFTLTDTKATKDEAARTMRSSEDVNSNYSSSLDVPRSSPNSSNPYSPNRDPGQPELPQIPKLLDESGRDLLVDELSAEGSKLARKWSNDTLRRFDRFWYGPARSLFPHWTQLRSSPIQDGISSRRSMSSERSHSSITDTSEHNVPAADELSRSSNMRYDSRRLFHRPLSRFYKPKIMQEKLLSPENYKN